MRYRELMRRVRRTSRRRELPIARRRSMSVLTKTLCDRFLIPCGHGCLSLEPCLYLHWVRLHLLLDPTVGLRLRKCRFSGRSCTEGHTCIEALQLLSRSRRSRATRYFRIVRTALASAITAIITIRPRNCLRESQVLSLTSRHFRE